MSRPIAVLHVADMQERAGATAGFARSVLAAMTGNAWFPSPPVPLPTFEDRISALDAAEAAVLFSDANVMSRVAQDVRRAAQGRSGDPQVLWVDAQVACEAPACGA